MAISLVFPGQGSQKPGMARDFVKNYPQSAAVFKAASLSLSYDMQEICFVEDDRINQTEYTQPAILTVEIAILQALKSAYDLRDCYFAGHSLGEYSALVAAGVINFSDALKIVQKRGQLMQNAVGRGSGAMVALSAENIINHKYITAIERQEVEIANYNSQNQLVISGMKEHLEHAVSEMIAEFPEISPVFLRVSAPFHCSHMKSIEPEFREFLLRYDSNFSYSYVSRVLSNFSGTFHRPETLIANLVSQISSPVLWTKNMEEISALGGTILEIGPNRVLSKFFSGAGNKSESVYDLRSFKKFIQSGSQECTL